MCGGGYKTFAHENRPKNTLIYSDKEDTDNGKTQMPRHGCD